MQDLFPETDIPKITKLGKSTISYKKAASILTKASGFIGSYDYTLNPYSGCTFGCTYCYAAFFSRTDEERRNWGYWTSVKENALQLLKKYRKKNLHGKTIYMSSVTDPYQPIENRLELTRSLLKELLEFHQPKLVIQTRSPLVVRDIDLFTQFENVQINMTVTTDSEKVRKVFEPFCPSNQSRLNSVRKLNAAHIMTCITMTPLLPVEAPLTFAKMLRQTGTQKFIVQPFHSEKGKFVAGTRDQAMNLIKSLNWTKERYTEVESILIKEFPSIGIGKDGFKPT